MGVLYVCIYVRTYVLHCKVLLAVRDAAQRAQAEYRSILLKITILPGGRTSASVPCECLPVGGLIIRANLLRHGSGVLPGIRLAADFRLVGFHASHIPCSTASMHDGGPNMGSGYHRKG